MCTVTFIPRKTAYFLGMNRDEKLTRVSALPPKRRTIDGRAVAYPSEPSGGTWISLNDTGTTFALINWYSVPSKPKGNVVSRGQIIPTICTASEPGIVTRLLADLPLRQINPFRLIGIFPASYEITEWQWDIHKLVRENHYWEARQWISSGFDEPTAQRERSKTFKRAGRQYSGALDWLRRLHRSHSPQTGPFATCMHRADAATVSYTEVAVSLRHATMHYHAGAPCTDSTSFCHHLRLGPNHSLVASVATSNERAFVQRSWEQSPKLGRR